MVGRAHWRTVGRRDADRVLDGHTVVLVTAATEAVTFDVRDGTERRCRIPDGLMSHNFLGGRYDAPARCFVAKPAGFSQFLVAQNGRDPQWCAVAAHWTPVWVGEHELLLDTAEVLNLRTGECTPVPFDETAPLPRLDVTGRFDLLDVGSSLGL